MAKINIVKAIANGTALSDIGFDGDYASTNVIYQRTDGEPLDSSEIFFNELSAKAYANGTLQPGRSGHQFGTQSYVGQHITVVNEALSSVDMYQIQNEAGELKKLLAEPLKGKEFDFTQNTLGDIIQQVISALGGTVLTT